MPNMDLITLLLLAVLVLSMLRGAYLGTRRTAAGLGSMFSRLLLRVFGILAALLLAGWCSPYVRDWADRMVLDMPAGELPKWKTAGYTLLGFVSDFSLLRMALLFLLIYPVCLTALSVLGRWRTSAAEERPKRKKQAAGGKCFPGSRRRSRAWPGSRNLERHTAACAAVRLRVAVAGKPAQPLCGFVSGLSLYLADGL